MKSYNANRPIIYTLCAIAYILAYAIATFMVILYLGKNHDIHVLLFFASYTIFRLFWGIFALVFYNQGSSCCCKYSLWFALSIIISQSLILILAALFQAFVINQSWIFVAIAVVDFIISYYVLSGPLKSINTYYTMVPQHYIMAYP